MKKTIIYIGVFFSIGLIISIFLFYIGKNNYNNFINSIEKYIINDDEKLDNNEKIMPDGIINVFDGNVVINTDEEKTFNINIEENGEYEIILEYKYLNNTSNNGSLELKINNSSYYLTLIDNYSYYENNIDLDRYGNEIVPNQIQLSNNISIIKDGKRIKNKLYFNLQNKNNITIRNLKAPILIRKIFLKKKENLISYDEYIKNYENEPIYDSTIIIEAENLALKSDSLISIGNLQTSQITPFEIRKKKLNHILENSFSLAGQKVFWILNIEKSGLYNLGFRYIQTTNKGIPSYRRIEIDGKVLFKELNQYPFKYTGYNWKDEILGENSPFYFYLEKGKHIISMEVTTGPYENYIIFLKEKVKYLQNLGLDIRKLIGNNFDPNRTWDIVKYMPNIVDDLSSLSKELEDKYNELIKLLGEDSRSSISDLMVSAELIKDILKEPERIPFYLDVISEGSASIAQRLSNLSLKLKEQPIGLDKIYVFTKFPELNYNSSLISAYEELYKLYLSLLNKNESYSVYEEVEENTLNIWVNRPVQYVETLQYLIDSDFTKKYGINVKLSIMQNEQKLILASAAGNSPDVALSISSWIPFELAIRGALYPLSDFKDFIPSLENDYNLEILLPMVIEDKIYGVTETQNFYVLMYRKDILDKLNIPVPNTWDDVKKILPELQRRGMNFFIPLSEQTTKFFNTTAPFIFQNKGKIYSKDGLKAAISDENSIKGFELMTELYSIYGLPEQVASFYNDFRYGKTPIGISEFNNYNLLTNAADEIYGLWDIAPSPGVKIGDTIYRYQVSSDRADVIFKSSNKKDEAWLFLKWWLSKETQVKYAKALVNRYGPEYMWNTANISAFKELDYFPENHKQTIIEQWNWIKEVQRHPGGYMTEREVSNIWNMVVIEGKELRPSIDRSEILINRELERKLTEFGYVKDGKVIKEYTMYDSIFDLLERWNNE
ncbi:MAG: ABC transporter substrate-binding protein [Marinitoga sp. 4572_148]|nr:MAG: ABC transporter substrate-binding protein [Marinitoga sp. 4572_148]